MPRHDFLARIRRHRIDSRKICNQSVCVSSDHAVFSVYRHAREIPNMLVGTCKLIEQSRLPAVLVSRKRKRNRLPLRQRTAICFYMINPAFAQSGVVCLCFFFVFIFGFFLRFRLPFCAGCPLPFFIYVRVVFLNFFYLNLFSVRKPQCQFVSMNPKFHRISHRSKLHKLDFGSGHHSHVQKMLSQRALPPDRLNPSAFPDF